MQISGSSGGRDSPHSIIAQVSVVQVLELLFQLLDEVVEVEQRTELAREVDAGLAPLARDLEHLDIDAAVWRFVLPGLLALFVGVLADNGSHGALDRELWVFIRSERLVIGLDQFDVDIVPNSKDRLRGKEAVLVEVALLDVIPHLEKDQLFALMLFRVVVACEQVHLVAAYIAVGIVSSLGSGWLGQLLARTLSRNLLGRFHFIEYFSDFVSLRAVGVGDPRVANDVDDADSAVRAVAHHVREEVLQFGRVKVACASMVAFVNLPELVTLVLVNPSVVRVIRQSVQERRVHGTHPEQDNCESKVVHSNSLVLERRIRANELRSHVTGCPAASRG